jgi:hypothetical protein
MYFVSEMLWSRAYETYCLHTSPTQTQHYVLVNMNFRGWRAVISESMLENAMDPNQVEARIGLRKEAIVLIR